MEFWITIVGLVRRKGVVIPALLIAVALAVTAYLMTPISYVSSSTMVLTTTQFGGTESRDPTKPTDLTNPLLNFNDSLTTTSAILIEAMNTGSVDRQLGITGSTQLVASATCAVADHGVRDGCVGPDEAPGAPHLRPQSPRDEGGILVRRCHKDRCCRCIRRASRHVARRDVLPHVRGLERLRPA